LAITFEPETPDTNQRLKEFGLERSLH